MTQISNQAKAAREGARHHDGKFGTQVRAENDADLARSTDYDMDELFELAWQVDYDTDLSRVHEGFVIPDELIDDILAGNQESAILGVNDLSGNYDWDKSWKVVEKFEADLGIKLYDEDRQEVEGWVRENDTTDLLAQAAAQTPDLDVAAEIATLDGFPEPLSAMTMSKRVDEIYSRAHALAEAVFGKGYRTTPEQNDALREVVEHGPDTWDGGVTLEVVWRGPITDLISKDTTPLSAHDRNLGFESPKISLSGADTASPAVTLPVEYLSLDGTATLRRAPGFGDDLDASARPAADWYGNSHGQRVRVRD